MVNNYLAPECYCITCESEQVIASSIVEASDWMSAGNVDVVDQGWDY